MFGKRTLAIALGVVVVLSVVLSACAPAATPTPQVIVKKETQVVVVTATPAPPTPEPAQVTAPLPDVIKIGVNETMTGWGAPYGDMTWKGIQLAHKKQPEVLGRPVELVLADNKSDNTESALVAQRFIDVEKVLAVIGVNSSSKAIAQNEVLDPAGVPAMGSACTNPLVTLDKPHAFRACFIDPFQGWAGAKYAVEVVGAKTACLLVDIAEDYPVGLANYFRSAFIEMTGDAKSILGYFSFQTGDTDFTAQLTAIKQLDPDLVFCPAEYAEIAAILVQAQQLGLTPDMPFLAGDSADVPELIEIAGDAANGFCYTAQFHPDAYTHPEAVEFSENFRAAYNLEPETFSVTGYDAYLLLMNAIERAGSVDREAITKALKETKGVVVARGPISFDDQGNAVLGCPVICIQDGKKTAGALIEPE